jgi:lysophospholipase L1-like esterase
MPVLAQQAAEVPAEVAIARPTEAELNKASQALNSFKQGVDAETKAILQRFPELVEVRAPRVNTAIIPALSPQFTQKHQSNLARAAEGNVDILFMGDSITDFWRNDTGNFAGKVVQDKYFSQWNVANFGIAGDTTQGVLYRLQNGEGSGFQPKAIMLMIGTNNTRGNTAAEIAEGVGAIVLQLQKGFPQAKILLLAVFPRGANNDPVRDVIADINTTIARLDDNEKVFYLDIGEVFLDANGNIPASVMSDGLHPSTEGYELWGQAVIEPIKELME